MDTRQNEDKLKRAYSLLTIKEFDDEKREITGMASTPTVDRVGDIVEPMGAKFQVPMPLLLDHDHHSQVGHVEFAKPSKAGIPFKARIVRVDEIGEVKTLTDKAWHLVKHKLRAAVSIGFKPLKDGVEALEEGGLRFKAWEWLELSLVSVPANREALIYEAKSLADESAIAEISRIDAELLAASGHEQEGDDVEPGATGKSEPKPCAKGHVVKLKDTKPAKPFVIRNIRRT